MGVPRLRILVVEVAGNATRLPRVLRLAVSLLLFPTSVAEHGVVPDPIHLRLMLLPEIEGMRLQVVAHAGTQILLRLRPLGLPHLVLALKLLHLHLVSVTSARLTRLLQVMLLHE